MIAVLADRGRSPADFQSVTDTIRSALGTDIALVGLTLPDRGARILGVSGARHPERFLGLEIPPARGITGKALSELRPISTNNYLQDYTFVHSDQYDRINATESVVTKAVCPVLQPPFNKIVFGVIIVANRSSQPIDIQSLISVSHSLASSSSVCYLPISLLLDHLSYIFVKSFAHSWTFSQIQSLCSRIGVDISEINSITVDGALMPGVGSESIGRFEVFNTDDGTFVSVSSRWFMIRCRSLDLYDRMVVERFVCGLLAMYVAHEEQENLPPFVDESVSGQLFVLRSWRDEILAAPDDKFSNVMFRIFSKSGVAAKVHKISIGFVVLRQSDAKLARNIIRELVMVHNDYFHEMMDVICFGMYHGTEKQMVHVASVLARSMPRCIGVQDFRQCPSDTARFLMMSDAATLFKSRWRSTLESVTTNRLKIWADSLQTVVQHSSLRKAANVMGIPESSLRARIHVIEKALGVHITGCGVVDVETALNALREEIGRRDQRSITR